MTTPLLLLTVPLSLIPTADLIPTCRKLTQYDGDWLFLKSKTSLVALQLHNHNNPVSATKELLHETISPFASDYSVMTLEPSIGFLSRSGQTIPPDAYTTIVKYRTTPGARGRVIDLCRDLFAFAEREELDVYSLAILNSLDDEDEFVILERYQDVDSEKRHLTSDKCVKCLAEIKGMIAGHESTNFDILDV
jgi:quinol monooxygenase YgiN